jgi:ABC-type phosphate transport system permease subunit
MKKRSRGLPPGLGKPNSLEFWRHDTQHKDAKGLFATLSITNVVMLSVIMLSVVAPEALIVGIYISSVERQSSPLKFEQTSKMNS